LSWKVKACSERRSTMPLKPFSLPIGNWMGPMALPKAARAESRGAVEVGVLAVHLVDEEEAGEAALLGEAPGLLGADLDAGGGVDEDDGGVGDAEGGFDLAQEVGVAGGVEQRLTLRFAPLNGATAVVIETVALVSSGSKSETVFPSSTPRGGWWPLAVKRRASVREVLPAPLWGHEGDVADPIRRVVLHRVPPPPNEGRWSFPGNGRWLERRARPPATLLGGAGTGLGGRARASSLRVGRRYVGASAVARGGWCAAAGGAARPDPSGAAGAMGGIIGGINDGSAGAGIGSPRGVRVDNGRGRGRAAGGAGDGVDDRRGGAGAIAIGRGSWGRGAGNPYLASARAEVIGGTGR
jgi:hypothetical protein